MGSAFNPNPVFHLRAGSGSAQVQGSGSARIQGSGSAQIFGSRSRRPDTLGSMPIRILSNEIVDKSAEPYFRVPDLDNLVFRACLAPDSDPYSKCGPRSQSSSSTQVKCINRPKGPNHRSAGIRIHFLGWIRIRSRFRLESWSGSGST